MGEFTALVHDVSPSARLSKPPRLQPTNVSDPHNLSLFRAWLLKTPGEFSARLRIPAVLKGKKGEIHIELTWMAAGDTVGVAFWSNRDHTVAASVLLNGLESADDLRRVDEVLARRGYAIPATLRTRVDDERERPLMVTLFYSRGAMRVRQLWTIIPTFARAYFDLFGTTEK